MSARQKVVERVALDDTRALLQQLGLEHAAEVLADQLSLAVKEDVAHHRFVDRLLGVEAQRREENRVRTSLRLSGLPTGQTLDNFDWSFQPGIDRKRFDALATCEWVRAGATVLLQGPPGVGKTHLAVALGVRAVSCGFSVAHFRLDDLTAAMRRDADLPPRRLRQKKYMRPALLIIDEMGFAPLSRADAALLFRLVSYRYGRGATIITTNKSVKDWPEILANDEAMTAALLDRLLHRAHVFNIQGRSYRLRDLEKLLARES
jgi:DNA replication protein DnaC